MLAQSRHASSATATATLTQLRYFFTSAMHFLFPLGVCPSSLRYNLRSLRLVISQSDRRFCHLAFRAWAAEVQMSKKRNKIYQLSLKKKQHKSKEKEPQQDDQVRHQGTC
jgi:hypothetical protein